MRMATFSYKLPECKVQSSTIYNDAGKIEFKPPVFLQRYSVVTGILSDPRWQHEISKVAEFGVAEMGYLELLRRIDNVEHIVQVDIDKEVLKKHCARAEPLIYDYAKKRSRPLHIDVCHGGIEQSSKELHNVDAVVAIELVEHLEDDVLRKVPTNIFGFVQPKLAVISTPNADYNVLFNLDTENGFRHWDHKFEWTRQQFEHWCLDITRKYKNYSVTFLGAGDPPASHPDVGFVSQIAVFARNDLLGKPLMVAGPVGELAPPIDNSATYELIKAVDYPYEVDERTPEEKLICECRYAININMRNEELLDYETSCFHIPIANVLSLVDLAGFDVDKERLIQLLGKFDIVVKDDHILVYQIERDSDFALDDMDDYDDIEPLTLSDAPGLAVSWD